MPVQETRAERAFDYARTVALSDGVFAIALTLLVLNIGLPSTRDLGSGLLHRLPQFGSYALGFAVIALLWVRHHSFFRVLARIDTGLTVLNLSYLAFVAFLPYPTRIIGLHGDQTAAVVLYATTVAILGTIAGLMRVHARRARLLSPEGPAELARREHWLISPAVFTLSIPVAFASPRAAMLCWLVILLPTRVLHGGRR